jgi:mitochondrial-processing peptidase subunit beta
MQFEVCSELAAFTFDCVMADNTLFCSVVAEGAARELLTYGRRLPRAELFARIDAVDANTIRAVADRFIYDQDPAIAAVGDTQFMPDYNWFRRRTYWLRY